jgi:hypothetical protein
MGPTLSLPSLTCKRHLNYFKIRLPQGRKGDGVVHVELPIFQVLSVIFSFWDNTKAINKNTMVIICNSLGICVNVQVKNVVE